MEVERPPPSSYELFQTWRQYGFLGYDTPLIPPIPDISAESLPQLPLCATTDAIVVAFPSTLALENSSFLSNNEEPVFAWNPPAPTQKRLYFPAQPPLRIRRGTKRYRRTSDVDGPNTATLSSKKRRLRADLITSRLSQPFSQPATHILNREGMEYGDRRFLKLATTIDSARRASHLRSTSFLRFSVMNRLRGRLGLARPGSKLNGDIRREGDSYTQPQTARTMPDSLGGVYFRPPKFVTNAVLNDAPATKMPPRQEVNSHQNSQIAPTCRLSKLAALPLPSFDIDSTMQRTIPSMHPMPSPEPRPPRSMYDDFEEDSFAHLHPEDGMSDAFRDDPDEVYCDFGAIYGVPSPEASKQDDHTYEEYFDELDGISWATR